jgi:Putative transposase
VSCDHAFVHFRYRDAKSGKLDRRTARGADFLWLVLQHVLPKGLRRVRNFDFLHPNGKRLIALVHLLLKFSPAASAPYLRPRAPFVCVL